MSQLLLAACCLGLGFLLGCAWSAHQVRSVLADIRPAIRRSSR